MRGEPLDRERNLGGANCAALQRLEQRFLRGSPDLVLGQGDTNATPAGALAAVKMGILVEHVESGLPSYDRRMPTSSTAGSRTTSWTCYFAEGASAGILRAESCRGEVHLTGNTAIDACLRYAPKAPFATVRTRTVLSRDRHRTESVDDPQVLRELIAIFTVSPRRSCTPSTRGRGKDCPRPVWSGKVEESANVAAPAPTGYPEFLPLFKRCSLVLTNSGGIQEEATTPNIRKKVFVLRDSTERPEAVLVGFAEIPGTSAQPVLARIELYLGDPSAPTADRPFGDRTAGLRIVGVTLGGA